MSALIPEDRERDAHRALVNAYAYLMIADSAVDAAGYGSEIRLAVADALRQLKYAKDIAEGRV